MKLLLVGSALIFICLAGCQSSDPVSPKDDAVIDVNHAKTVASDVYTLYHSEAKDVLPKDLYDQYKNVKVVFKFDNSVRPDTFTIENMDVPRISLEVSNTNENKDLAHKLNELIDTTYPGLSKGVQTKTGSQNDKHAPADAIIINLGHTLGSSEEKYAALEVVKKIVKGS